MRLPTMPVSEVLDVAMYINDAYVRQAPRSACEVRVGIAGQTEMRLVLVELPDGSIVRIWPGRTLQGEFWAVEFTCVWPRLGGVRVNDRFAGPGEVWVKRSNLEPAQPYRSKAGVPPYVETLKSPENVAALRLLAARAFALDCPSWLRRPVDLSNVLLTPTYRWAWLEIDGLGVW